MSIKTRLIAGAGALTLAAGAMAIVAPAASAADQNLLSCTGNLTYASLNPTLGSGSAKYVKVAAKRADGTKHLSLTGAEDFGPTAPDATVCTVDAGIRTNNPATNSASGKDNPFDNLANGHSTLTLTKEAGSFSGSSSCNRDEGNTGHDYPASYPINGKMVWFFAETDALTKPIQMQQYIRLGSDPADTALTHITATGTVIKGPGIGGTVNATLEFGALFDLKGNLNLLDCTTGPNAVPPSVTAGNASLKTLLIQQADGPDVGATIDPWTVSIPGA